MNHHGIQLLRISIVDESSNLVKHAVFARPGLPVQNRNRSSTMAQAIEIEEGILSYRNMLWFDIIKRTIYSDILIDRMAGFRVKTPTHSEVSSN
jgi:hypothetical protein